MQYDEYSSLFIGYKKVAVKMLKASHSREEVADLLSEFKYYLVD